MTASLRGEAADFAELARAPDPAAALINGELELQGDSAPLIELAESAVAIDVETGRRPWSPYWAM